MFGLGVTCKQYVVEYVDDMSIVNCIKYGISIVDLKYICAQLQYLFLVTILFSIYPVKLYTYASVD
jgi:hypothetical protein